MGDKKFVYVDMGLKDYALLPREEISLTGERAEDKLSIGETREFVVIRTSNRAVQPIVSLKALEMEAAWERARQWQSLDTVVDVLVTETTRGGYRVNMKGLKSFLPISQVV